MFSYINTSRSSWPLKHKPKHSDSFGHWAWSVGDCQVETECYWPACECEVVVSKRRSQYMTDSGHIDWRPASHHNWQTTTCCQRRTYNIHQSLNNTQPPVMLQGKAPPFPHIDIIRAMVIVWGVRGKIIIVTWWGGPGGIEAWSLGLLLPSVLWHCRLGHLTSKTCPRYDL